MAGLQDYLSDKYQTENIKAINERLLELSSLFEISQILNSSLELNEVLNNILLIPMGRLMVSRGAILLKTGDNFLPRLWKGIGEEIKNISFSINDLPSKVYSASDDPNKNHQNQSKNFLTFLTNYRLAIAVPIISQNQLIGLVLYGQKLTKQTFSEEEIDFMLSLANLSATAVVNALKVEEIKNINFQLDERVQQLKTLFDIAQGLSATLDSDKIVKLLIYALMGQMLVYHYAIVIQRNGELQKIDCKGFLQDNIEILSKELSKYPELKSPVIVDSLSTEELRDQLWNMGARIFIPLRHQNQNIGFILLGEKINKQKYSDVDVEFLTTLINQAVISIENARLFKETLEKQRIEQELQVAKTIQSKLLPREIIPVPGYDFWGINKSSKEVGGDYYDVIGISDRTIALAIADVSGKSVPAALLMANLQAGLRSLIRENIPLNQIVGRLNNLIHQNTDLDKYITFFVGTLDTEINEFTYVNAGHNPPILYHQDGVFDFLEMGGIILGMIPDYQYQTGKIILQPKDTLICYTDGVNEALNSDEEEYGEERLQNFITQKNDLSSHALAEALVSDILQFTRGTPQYDDITLLIGKRK
jgi:sigma-B regulation protein RsbU (phosphoserine phosphatase)